MAHCFIMDFADGSAAGYDAVMREMDLGGRVPAGAIFHGAGAPEAGGWRVVDVWETPEAFGRFAEEKIGPITASQGFPPPAVTDFPVSEMRHGASATATFLHVVRLAGVDAATFSELDRRVGPELPEGLVFHVNGPLDGGWVTVGYWTSKGARDSFIQERVMPALSGAAGPPTIEDLPLHNVLGDAPA